MQGFFGSKNGEDETSICLAMVSLGSMFFQQARGIMKLAQAGFRTNFTEYSAFYLVAVNLQDLMYVCASFLVTLKGLLRTLKGKLNTKREGRLFISLASLRGLVKALLSHSESIDE